MRAILTKPDGSTTEIQPKNGKEFSLDELYSYIECSTVEHLDLARGVHLWVDEEGRLSDSPKVNPVATRYFLKAFPPESHLFPGGIQDIVGNAIITQTDNANFL